MEAAALIDRAIESAWAAGYRRFMSGGALGIDTIAAERVLAAQLRHPELRLLLILPCGDQSDRWRPEEQMIHRRLRYAADETRLLARRYYPGCMLVRNRYMADRSSLCIAYMRQMRSGTLQTVHYALSRDIRVVNLLVEEV